MTGAKTVEKNLITQEDIDIGESTTNQTRGGGSYPLNQVRLVAIVNSLVELNALNTLKYKKAILFTNSVITLYYFSTVWRVATTLCKTKVTATDLSTIPNVDNIEVLQLSNSGATSITDFVTAQPKEIELFFTNSNTTLVHNAAKIILKGAINVTPVANSIITLVKYSTVWIEKSRNF